MASQYLTVSELHEMPLGVEWRNIPATQPNTPAAVSTAENYRQLTNLIIRASGLADLYCSQVLTATIDVEEKITEGYSCGIDRQGYLWVHTNFWPVISVLSMQYAYPQLGGTTWQPVAPSDLFVSGDLSDIVTYPAGFARNSGPPFRVQYTYLNGWPCTMMSAAVGIGSLTLPVKDAVGIVAGQALTLYDGASTEAVTVSASWVPMQGPATVALATGTQYAHTPVFAPTAPPAQPYDISVTTLPPEVKQAVGLICKRFADQRGMNAIAASVVGRSSRAGGRNSIEGMLHPLTCEILDNYSRII